MGYVQRVGDANTGGGVVRGGDSSVKINGRPVALVGDSVTGHPCCGRRGCPGIHCGPTTSGGSSTVKVGGRSVSLTGDPDTCGHTRAGGSTDVSFN